MAKSLNDILKQARDTISGKRDEFAGDKKVVDTKASLGKEPGVDYRPKAGDEGKFADAHSVEKHEYPYGNEAMFTGKNVGYSLDAQINNRVGNDLKQSMDAEFVAKEEVKHVDEAKEYEEKACNETKAGVYCPVHEMGNCMEMKKLNEKGVKEEHIDEKYMGFEKLKGKLAAKGAKSPGALAAWIGRKKYGKGKFQKAAAAGKKMDENVEQVDEKVISPYAVGMAVAKKKYGYGTAPAKDLPKKVITKGHEIAKKVMAKEEIEQVDEKVKMSKADIAALASPKDKFTGADLAALRAGKHKKKQMDEMIGNPAGAPGGYVQPMLEDDPDSHHDREESEMARTQLKALANKALHLVMQMPENMHVEPWIQSKIANAKEMVSAVHDYLVYGDHDHDDDKDKDEMTDMSGGSGGTLVGSQSGEREQSDTVMKFPNMSVDVNTGQNV
jgi:hypothetical protein